MSVNLKKHKCPIEKIEVVKNDKLMRQTKKPKKQKSPEKDRFSGDAEK